jgi:hypothetical protein
MKSYTHGSYSLEPRGCALDVSCIEDVLCNSFVERLRTRTLYVIDAYLVSDESRLGLLYGQVLLSQDLGRACR